MQSDIGLEKIKAIMELMQTYGVQLLECGDLKLEMHPSFFIIPKEEPSKFFSDGPSKEEQVIKAKHALNNMMGAL